MGLLDESLNDDRKIEIDRELEREELTIEDLRDMRSEELIERIDDVVPYMRELTLTTHENDDIVREVCDIYTDRLYKTLESTPELDEKIEFICHYARIQEVCPTDMLDREDVFRLPSFNDTDRYFDERYGASSMSATAKDLNEYERFADYRQGLLDVMEERGMKDPMLSYAIKNIGDDERINHVITEDDRLLEPCLNGFIRSLSDDERASFLPLPVDEDRRTELSVDEAFARTLLEHPPVHEIPRDREAELLSDKFEVIAEARGMEDDRYFREALMDMREEEERGEGSIFKVNELNDYMINFMDSLTTEERMYLIPRDAAESEKMYEQYGTEFCRTINGYANLNDEMLDRMADLLEDRKCLEVMAGPGLLSACLQERGIDILATERDTPDMNAYATLRDLPTLCEVQYMDALDAIREHGEDIDVLVMSWPPYNDPIASDCVSLLYEVNPKAEILYIGEGYEGCTADDIFFLTTEYIHSPLCDAVNEAKGESNSGGWAIHDQVEMRKPSFK